VLRDLADLAAAIPTLDHDLSEALLPWLKGGADLAVPYAMLTHPGHDAVRVCSSEIRSRVPAVPPSTTPPPSVPAVHGTGELDKAMDSYVRTVAGWAASGLRCRFAGTSPRPSPTYRCSSFSPSLGPHEAPREG